MKFAVVTEVSTFLIMTQDSGGLKKFVYTHNYVSNFMLK